MVVPFFNTNSSYIEQVIHSLNCQTRQPDNVLFINDGSDTECVEKVTSLLRQKARFRHQLISHKKNFGLAAARNTALRATSADILVNLDSDDVALPDFLRDICQAFEVSQQTVVCMPYMASFVDGADYNRKLQPQTSRYRPVGDGIIASQVYNQLGHANSGVRVRDSSSSWWLGSDDKG